MSASSNTNPIAVCVKSNWDPSTISNKPSFQSSHPYMAVTQGLEGWLGASHVGFSLVVTKDNRRRGWVPTSILDQGERRRTTLPIEIISNSTLLAPSNPQLPDANTPHLLKACKHLWAAIRANQARILEALPGLPPNARDHFFGNSVNSYADSIYSGFSNEVRNALNKETIDIDDLIGCRQVTNNWPPKGSQGIYIIIYTGTKDGKPWVAVYVGQTKNFQNRNRQHKNRVNGSRSNHYRIADQAEHRYMIPVFMFTNGSASLDVAELTLVCLFNSWWPVLLRQTNINLHASYAIDCEAAAIFSAVSQASLDASGWKTPRFRGLNWNTPVVRNAKMGQQWTSWHDDSKNMKVYRIRKNIVIGPDTCMIKMGGWQQLSIPKALLDAAKFTNGQQVHLIAEISTAADNRPHPFRYVRFPSIGLNPQLSVLERLAFRLEWFSHEDGKWWTDYLCRAKLWQTATDHPNISAMYQLGLAVFMDLTQTSFINAPDWVRTRPPVEVKTLSYDHLGQKLQATKVQRRQITWPSDNTFQQNRQRLLDAFPPNRFPAVSIGFKPEGWKRMNCDLCYSAAVTTACQFEAATGTCNHCSLLNRPCTFTRGSRAELIQRLQQHFGDLEELAVTLNIYSSPVESGPRQLANEPFDPRVEDEEHTVADQD